MQSCLLAKIWYVAQILPPNKAHTRQLTTTCTWYIWQGMTSRIPITTLHRQKTQGGWAMLDVAGKCRALLLYRKWILNSRESSVIASWLEHWSLKEPIPNPPNRNTIPNKLTYVTHCALDMAYVTPLGNTETHKKFKRRLYKALLTLAKAERGDQELRVTQKHPTILWTRVRTTLHTAWIPECLKSLWYTVIHDIVPTNERLAAIRLSDTELCNQCGKTDIL